LRCCIKEYQVIIIANSLICIEVIKLKKKIVARSIVDKKMGKVKLEIENLSLLRKVINVKITTKTQIHKKTQNASF